MSKAGCQAHAKQLLHVHGAAACACRRCAVSACIHGLSSCQLRAAMLSRLLPVCRETFRSDLIPNAYIWFTGARFSW